MNTIRIKTLDMHAAGEPCRVIYDYFYDLPGETMFEKKLRIMRDHAHICNALIHEPRGHANMFGAILTAPVSADADVGVIFLTNSGVLDMCIHGSICTSRAILELGLKVKNKEQIVLDIVGGQVRANVHYNENQKIDYVEIENVPSFVYNERPVIVPLADGGKVEADIVFAGNFFAIVDGSENPKLRVCPENYTRLTDAGMEIKKYINEHYTIEHPSKPELRDVNLTVIFNRRSESPKHVQNIVVFGNRQTDRSPCGTGTSGMMVYFKEKGELALNQEFISESLIGSFFYGHLKEEIVYPGERTTYIPRIKGKPSISAYSEFVLEPDDIYRNGIPVVLL